MSPLIIALPILIYAAAAAFLGGYIVFLTWPRPIAEGAGKSPARQEARSPARRG